jgi:hypothetical protein
MAYSIWLVATKSRTGKSFMGKITDQQQLLPKAYTISYVLSAAFMLRHRSCGSASCLGLSSQQAKIRNYSRELYDIR